MNHTPRSHRTPADRDLDAFEASRLRALSLRQEAIGAFWRALAGATRRTLLAATDAVGRAFLHSHKGA